MPYSFLRTSFKAVRRAMKRIEARMDAPRRIRPPISAKNVVKRLPQREKIAVMPTARVKQVAAREAA